MRNDVVGLTGVMVALAVGLVWATREPGPPKPVEVRLADRAVAGASPPVSAAPAAAPGWGQAADSAGRADEFRSAYVAADDARTFFTLALQHPESGGYYYARRMLFDCIALRGAKSVYDANATNRSPPPKRPSPAAVQSFDAAYQRCNGLPDSDSFSRLRAAIVSEAKADPLARASQAMRQARREQRMTLDIALTTLDQAVVLGDPYLLIDSLREAINVATVFDGETLDDRLRSDLRGAAVVAQCGLGVDCERDVSIALACLKAEECPRNAMDTVLAQPGLSLDTRRRIIDLASRLVETTKDGSLPRLFRAA